MKKTLIRFSNDIIIFTLIVATSLAHYLTDQATMPAHSFIRLIYLIPIILSGFYYGFKGALLISLAISLIYSPHILLSVGLGSDTINELLDILLFFVIGVIVGTLSEKKNLKNAQLEENIKKHAILQQYSSSIIESIKSGVIVINKDMFITIINQGALDILGAEDNCIGKNFMEIFNCCTDIRHAIMKAVNENKVSENIEIQLEKRHTDISISIYPLTLNSTNKGLVIIVDDITELKKLQMQAQRNEKLVALGELSSGIAHEIRNPLAIIKAIEQTMKNELKDNIEAIKELDIIDEEVERANRIVMSLMEFAKPSRSEVKLFYINEILDDVLLIINKYIAQRNIKLEINLAENVQINADVEQLKQAFINIMFNAAEAMENGGIIRVSTSVADEKWIRVVFEDTGTGIDEDNLAKIFNPFFTTKEKGTGLGLSIVHRILEQHKCIINVFSNIGEGTRFEIMFPTKREGAELYEKDINCR